ncbi:MAG TPA: Hsp20/alpha crystallin family protein [Aggregatilineales bacterium]|nr:Hsp20/alpha crystallin family protein [Anaerolineales bacterium]HRE47677.1 Hsp20/alpha crystallin family protein [Aggregatilineales bacterium]
MTDEPKPQPDASRFDPMKSLSNLRDSVSRVVEDGLSALGGQLIQIDIYETETTVVVQAGPLWGIDVETIDVAITGETLTLKGKTHSDPAVPAESYLRRERKFGEFNRAVKIPQAVKPNEAKADLRDALLTITLPKEENPQPKVVTIRAASS